jgi:predicted RNA binding protein YcfA (HicA-like mRNA interferase family)
MPKRYTADEVIKIVKQDGWYEITSEGGHKQFKHLTKKGRVTIPYHKGELNPKTVNSILKQAGLK